MFSLEENDAASFVEIREVEQAIKDTEAKSTLKGMLPEEVFFKSYLKGLKSRKSISNIDAQVLV